MSSSEYVVPEMHEGQVTATIDLVRRLLAEQFPHWADHLVTAIPGGTDHAMFRIGDQLLGRFPLTASRGQPALKARWLPPLAERLPLAVPAPVGLGEPAGGYPWQWTVVPWIEGGTFTRDPVALVPAAHDMSRFLLALHRVPSQGGPDVQPGQRGAPVGHLDEVVRPLIARLADQIDVEAVTAAWDYAMSAPAWTGTPVWLHTDLGPDNVIVRDGRIVGVIDFGLAVGDPAPDLLPAWQLFSGPSREVFLRETGYDAATQARALAWLLAPSLQGLIYYRGTRPDFVARSEQHIRLAVVAHRAATSQSTPESE